MFTPYCWVLSLLLISTVDSLDLPPFLTKCSRDLPVDELSQCIKTQAKIGQKYFADGLPEYDLPSFDPLKVGDITVPAGTFTIKSTDAVLTGLKDIDIRDIVWDFKAGTGHMHIFGNITLTSVCDLDGVVVLIPIKSRGTLTVDMYDTDMKFQYKYRLVKDKEGVEHWNFYDMKINTQFGYGKFDVTNFLDGGVIGDSVLKVFNDNWNVLMDEVGNFFVKSIVERISKNINNLFKKIPYENLL